MEVIYQPYIDPEYECLIERIYPPWVSIDNDTCKDCTLVKVDSANKDKPKISTRKSRRGGR